MQIPGYRILQPLGQGGMATVYLAVQESFDRQVALKIMAPELSRSDSAYGERFLREARIVAKLTDPHIVSVYDVGVHNGLHYLAMEYVPGQDLRQHFIQMTLKQCLTAIKQIAEALAHAHHQGFVHRDIKPENILIHRHSGRAILTDFGIAKPTGSDEEANPAGGALGTPSFMSPEQALGQSLDHRSDLYSLGVVSFYLLTGKVPFAAESPVAVSMKHALDAIPRLPSTLGRYQGFVDIALAKHPNQRFQSGYEFAHAVESLLANISATDEVAWKTTVLASVTAPEATRVAGQRDAAASTHADNAVSTESSVSLQRVSSGSQTGKAVFTVVTAHVGHFLSVVAAVSKTALVAASRLLQQFWLAAAPVLSHAWQRFLRALQWLWQDPQRRLAPAVAIAVVVAVVGWLLLREDWNLSSAREAYRDGELSKADYNAIIKELKSAHQERLDELRQALQEKDLTREEYLAAVRKAKQEYTGDADCGSFFGC